MNRRDMLIASGIAVTAAALGRDAAAQPKPAAAAPARPLAAVLADCLRAGEACLAHCAEEYAKGNKDMANCNRKVIDMLALARAMATVSAQGSPLAKAQARVCADGCKACKEACLEHKAHWAHGMHLACKECMEACEACEAACRAYAA